MAEELTRSLMTLAERGSPRGAAPVLDAARADVTEAPAPPRHPWRRGMALSAGAAAVVVLLLGIVTLLVRPFGGDEVAPADTEPPVTEPLPHPIPAHPLNQVEALAVAPDGQLWAATAGGVVRWDPASGEPTVFTEGQGIPASEAMAIDIAPDGVVWAAGTDWIARYDGSWQLFSADNTPLVDSQIEAMAVDGDGVVWVDVATEPPLHYDGVWTQGRQPPAGTWASRHDEVVAANGTRWAPSDAGITGFDGTDTVTLVVGPEIATPRRPTITLEPAPDVASLSVSTVIGDLEFDTWKIPVGYTFVDIASTPFGPVTNEGFNTLRWSADGVTWEGIQPPIDAWRITVDGADMIVYGDGYVRYAWDGDTWTETAVVALPGAARHMAFGSQGTVAIIEDRVYHAADGVTFVPAAAGPAPERLPAGAGVNCVQNGPSSSTSPPQPQFGPVLATETGFVLVTPAHRANWSRTPACEPLFWSSPDGDTWELASERSPFGEGAIVHNIAGHDGHWVAVGATPADELDGAIWVSRDALTWQRADVQAQAVYAVAGGPLGWVVTGTEGTRPLPATDLWFSADGITWDGPHPGPDALTTIYFYPELAVGPDGVHAVGTGHDVYVIGRLRE
jgi:hypothetical protein